MSIVVPCFNEEKAIPIFYKELINILHTNKLDYQILFIDNGSQDLTLQVIKLLAEEDPNAQYLSFSRNFGKEAAMLAGMRHSIGDLIVIMDVDLQDPPALIPQMIAAIEYHRFSKGIFGWAGYNTKWLEYQNVERVAGETKWSFWKLFKYAIEYFINRGFANDIFRNYRRVFVQNAHGS